MINKIYRTKEELKRQWDALKEHRFEGYIWLCESDKPILLEGAKLPEWESWGTNFIWEMNGYATEKLSLSVRFLGGCWNFSLVEWSEFSGKEIVTHQYLSQQPPPEEVACLASKRG